MAATLLLRLPAERAAPVAWLACEAGRVIDRGDDALAEGKALAEGRRIVVLAPGCSVLLTSVLVPSRKPQHIRRAVPYLLEERLATDVGQLHFAIGPRDDDGHVVVAVIEREWLASWIAALDAAALPPVVILPETLAVPLPSDGWLLAADTGTALLRSAACVGWALDRASAGTLLRGALAEAPEPPPAVTLCGLEVEELHVTVSEATEMRTADAPDLDALLASGADAQPVLNLLQGEFTREPRTRVRLRDFRQPALLAACLLILLLVQQLWQVWQLTDESARLDAQLRTTLRESVPDLTRVVDPVAQMRQHLAARQGSHGSNRFLDLLATSGEVLAADSDWQLAGLDYRDGVLQLQLRMPGFDHFERLRGRFAATGEVEADIGSLGSADGAVSGSVTVRGRGS